MTDPRPQISNQEELLFRQVNPSHCPEGVPTSPVFNPTMKDDFLLSLDRGAKVTAEDSHRRFTAQGFSSVMVLSVRVMDFAEIPRPGDEPLPKCPVYEDPNPPSNPQNDAHAEADYRGQSKGMRRHRAKLMLDCATQAFRPPG